MSSLHWDQFSLADSNQEADAVIPHTDRIRPIRRAHRASVQKTKPSRQLEGAYKLHAVSNKRPRTPLDVQYGDCAHSDLLFMSCLPALRFNSRGYPSVRYLTRGLAARRCAVLTGNIV